MRVIVPMAGMGKRLRPHTLTTPKPLFPIAGKPIVERLVEDIARLYDGKIDEICYITGEFGEAVEKQLIQVAERLGAKGMIFKQDKPLGTAHAVYCASARMDDELIIAFADTLFRADFKLDRSADGVLWVKSVENPKQFGVVTLDAQGHISGMVEKPDTFVSDLAIIGIYYIKDGAGLRSEIKHLLDNNITSKGEFQLTDALENMRRKGAVLVPGRVDAWMDCGNKDAVLDTNREILDFLPGDQRRGRSITLVNSTVIEPCFIGEGAHVENSVIGPHVSIGKGASVRSSVLKNAILCERASVDNACIDQTILGNDASLSRKPECLNLGDFSVA